MNWISTILQIVLKFLGWQERKEANLPIHEAPKLDDEIADLRNQRRAAADAGDVRLLNEVTARLNAASKRREALRDAGSAASGKGG